MDLDKRIKNNHRPLCVIDIKWAMGFIGKNGFFADAINCFENLSECQYGKLVDVKDKKIYPFECDNKQKYTFFIPEEWVKEPEKKYRPFSLNEFLERYMMGAIVEFRIKDCEVVEQSMLIGFQSSDDNDIPGDGYVLIGNCRYGLKELFNNYELYYLNKWQPFGVLDEGDE